MYGGQDRDMNEGPPAKRFQRDDNADPINPDPSIVVHVRNLSHKASEADLLEALSTFGPIAYAFVKRNHQMALVEFESLEGARACVEFAAGSQIYVAGQPAHFNYSTSQSIQRMGHECSTPNHVLVLTISNVQYPISVDVLHEICSPHGEVQRIRIVKRTHVITALVEFPSVEIAKATKHAINGADIYSGCCTLKVEFAGADHVRITRDEPDQRDFTLPPPEACAPPQRKTLMPAPDAVGAPPSYGGSPAPPPPGYPPVAGNGYPPVVGSRGGAPPTAPAYPAQRGYPPAAGDPYAADPYARNPYGYEAPEGYPPAVDPYAAPPRDPYGYGGGPAAGYHGEEGGGGETPGNVLMVYGLDQSKINCDMIFNIFCQYGDVLRIKFMRAKVDTAMVEMGSHEQVENALNYLQGVVFFGMTIELKPSFQVGVREVREPFDMPDGTPSFRDFSASRNLRFATPELATRNRMMYPSCVLHWYNSPPEMDEEKIKELFAERKAPAPISTFKFPAKSERSSSGTAEFESVEKANEALALANHTPVVSPAGKAPYIVKMSYTHSRSTSRYAEGSHSGEDHEGGDGGPSSSSRGGYRGRGRGRGDSRGRGGYRGGRGDFRGRGRGRGDYGGGGYGAPRDRYFN